MTVSSSRSVRHVTVFGELLLRLDTLGQNRFLQADQFVARYTGAEANVAVALAQLGLDTSVVSRVPDHALGQACVNTFRQYGIDTRSILRGGDRLGTLYVENGASQRPGRIIYDRAHSSFSQLKPEDFSWPRILKNSDWLHLSGTAPALGPRPRAAQAAALRSARKQGVKISYDCNYRSSLWSMATARKVLPPLIEGVDLFLGTAHDAKALFDIEGDPAASAETLRKKFGIEHVAFTLREVTNSSINRLHCLVASPKGVRESRSYEIHMVDRIGAGDAFAAGMIYGILAGWPDKRAIEFAAAACCLKHSIPGDFGLSTLEEVEELARTGESGRLRR